MQSGDIIEGKYELLRLMGEGGMGAVFEARHTRIGRRLALKTLHPHLTGDKQMVERFLREAQAAASIGSEYIVDITDADETAQGEPFLVMELLEGQDLAAIIDRSAPLEPIQAVTLIHQVCLGLGAAHQRGIVHRDLKPQNLFVTLRGDGSDWVKVLDFGIAKFRAALTEQGGALTVTGAVMGTPHYMSPEQARGAKDVDHRADIYAVGVILYELLAGTRPYEADNYNELIFMVSTTDPRPLSELRPEVEEELAKVVHRAMARDPADRFQTMREMAEALRPFSGLQTTRSVPSTLASTEQGRKDLPATQLSPSAKVPQPLPHTKVAQEAASPESAKRTRSRMVRWEVAGVALLAVVGLAGLGVAVFLGGDEGTGDLGEPVVIAPTPYPPSEGTPPTGQMGPVAWTDSVLKGTAGVQTEPRSPPEPSPPPKRPGVLAPEDRGFVDRNKGAGWGNRCFIHLRAGRLKAARAACNRGLAIAEGGRVLGAIYYNLGWISDEEGLTEEARWYYRKSLEVRPGHPSVIEKLRSMGDPLD